MAVKPGRFPVNFHKLEPNTKEEFEIQLSVDNYDSAKSALSKVIKSTQKNSLQPSPFWISCRGAIPEKLDQKICIWEYNGSKLSALG